MALTSPRAWDGPVDFASLVDPTIARPGRYLGNELGVESCGDYIFSAIS